VLSSLVKGEYNDPYVSSYTFGTTKRKQEFDSQTVVDFLLRVIWIHEFEDTSVLSNWKLITANLTVA
jgi:hypothetical protein